MWGKVTTGIFGGTKVETKFISKKEQEIDKNEFVFKDLLDKYELLYLQIVIIICLYLFTNNIRKNLF